MSARRQILAVVAFLTAAAVAGVARADLEHHESLEWSVCGADVVIDGTVTEWRVLSGQEHVLTVSRLNHADAMFRIPSPSMRFEVGARVIAIGRSVPSWGFSLDRWFDAKHAHTFVRDGQELTTLDAIADRLRSIGHRRHARAIDLPIDLGPHRNASLRVPADRETERSLLAMLESPDLSKRAMGAALLRPYESSANIERLLALLGDRSTFPGSETPIVCFWAVETLRVWEVPLPPTPCSGPPGGAPGPRPDAPPPQP